MNLLIVYASNSGSTYLVAKQLQKKLNSDLKKATDTNPDDFNGYDLILLGSPSWDVNNKEGQPLESMLSLMDSLQDTDLKGKKFAVFGCGDSSYLNFCGAVNEMEKFILSTGGTLITDSLKIDSYYFDLDNNVKKVEIWADELNKKLPVDSLF